MPEADRSCPGGPFQVALHLMSLAQGQAAKGTNPGSKSRCLLSVSFHVTTCEVALQGGHDCPFHSGESSGKGRPSACLEFQPSSACSQAPPLPRDSPGSLQPSNQMSHCLLRLLGLSLWHRGEMRQTLPLPLRLHSSGERRQSAGRRVRVSLSEGVTLEPRPGE